MQKYYTNVEVAGNAILYRGVENGKRVKRRINYEPTLFVPSNKETKFKSHLGLNLEPTKFLSMRDARDFIKKYDGVPNFEIYGNDKFQYVYISDKHPEENIDWSIDDILIADIDIEVGSDMGFPEVQEAEFPVTAITMYMSSTKKYHTWACGDYVPHVPNVVYTKCKDEVELLEKFISFWSQDYPDVVTGWNVKSFDIPYLVNRIIKLLGEDKAKKLSPWGMMNAREETYYNKKSTTYTLMGVAILDYLQLYRKYGEKGQQESYTLDHIAFVELKERKLSYSEYDSLYQLYKLDHQKFIEYNIRDVDLVERLNAKGRLIEMALTLAYDNKTNFEDVASQIRMWDAIIFNHLRAKHIVLPPKKVKHKTPYEGAYVKDPLVGLFNWVVSFDLTSLYPHLIMQYNISPETIVEPIDYTDAMRGVISTQISVDRLLNKEINLSAPWMKGVTLTPNGQFFRTDKQGFLAEIMEKMFNQRKVYKNKMLDAEQKREQTQDPKERKMYGDLISRYKNLQMAKKVSLNSAYGALGNEFFRFFDVRQAEAITLTGQLSIRWIGNALNDYLNKLLKTNTDYVIASDTDSVYLNLGPLVEKVYPDGIDDVIVGIDFLDKVCKEKLQPFIDLHYQELANYVHAYAQKMLMKREALANKGIWTSKKHYILNVYDSEGVRYASPKKVIHGLEAVKSSTPATCREAIKSAINIIIEGDEKKLQEFIEDFRQKFDKFPIEDIAFPRSVNGLDIYGHKQSIFVKGAPMHVKAALFYNHAIETRGLDQKYDKIQEGDKLKYIYLKTPNTFKHDVIAFMNRPPKEFELEKMVDYERLFNSSFIEPLNIILKVMGWHAEKQTTLDDFFA